MFQAWTQVKVTNAGSAFAGQAGYVIRNEAEGDKAVIAVKLDTGTVENFDPSELVTL
jgi:hypothetical protein